MEAYQIRPRFELSVPVSAAETLACMKRHLAETERFTGWVNGPYAELHLPPSKRQLWSPLLAVETEDTPSGARVRCRLQPEATVWTLFMVAAFAVVVGFCFAAFLGVSQVLAAQTPWAAYIGMPLAASAGTSLYILVLIGKKLGTGEMVLLCRAVRECLQELRPREVLGGPESDPAKSARPQP